MKNRKKSSPRGRKPSAKADVKPQAKGAPPRHNPGKKAQAKGDKKLKIDLFGLHAVREAWLNPKRHIHSLYITENALPAFDDALEKAMATGLKRPPPQIVDRAALDAATPPGSVHQGIALSCQELAEISARDIVIAQEEAEQTVLLMLDQVTDPHNVGAILRSACAFGAAGVIMQSRHAPTMTGILAKTACGGVEHIPVAYETNLTRCLETLQESGYTTIGLDERGDQPIHEVQPPRKTVLVLGAEGDGLRRLVREQCDFLVRLPTGGPIASLNVSNAAAVALYALAVPPR
jgi:23S rRNA (guanosine2251-2'-O)-methyltransferase